MEPADRTRVIGVMALGAPAPGSYEGAGCCSARFTVGVLCHSPPLYLPRRTRFRSVKNRSRPHPLTTNHTLALLHPSLRKHGCGENDPNGPVFDPVHGVVHHFYQVRSGRDRHGDTLQRDIEAHTRANESDIERPATERPARNITERRREQRAQRRHRRDRDDIEGRRCYAYTGPTLQTYDSH